MNKGGYYEEIVFLIRRYYVEISEYHSGCGERGCIRILVIGRKQ